VPKFPEIFENLKSEGITHEVSLQTLQRHIIIITGVVKDQTIKQIIITMERVGYLKKTRDGWWTILYWESYEDKLKRVEEEEKQLKKEEKKIDQMIPGGKNDSK